jgi:FixJ family two-component response regulator
MMLAIVDDDEDVRRALGRLLCSMGNEIALFESAEDFEAATVLVDCVVADVRLPGMSGVELSDRLRNRRPPTPVVLITGDGDRLTRELARAVDAPLMTKPFDCTALAAAIRQAISKMDSSHERQAQ